MHDGIYKRNDSPYWWASYTLDGKTIRKSTGIKIADDPRAREAKRTRAQLLLGQHRENADPGSHRWIDLVGHYIADRRATWRPATLTSYRLALKHLVAYFGEDSSLQSRAQVKAYLRDMAETLSPGTLNIHVTLMCSAYRYAQTELEFDIPNPWEGRIVDPHNARARYLTRAEADRLISAAEKHVWYLADFIRLALHTGLRHTELLGLTWDRINLDAGTITFAPDEQKNGKRSTIPLNAGARLALLALQQRQNGPYVFHRKGRRIYRLQKSWYRTREEAGLPDIHIHDLRRTFGSWLVQSGVPILAVSGLLRHSNINITARVYAHLNADEYRAAANVLDEPPKLRRVK